MSLLASILGCLAGVMLAGKVTDLLEAWFKVVSALARELSGRLPLPLGLGSTPVQGASFEAMARVVSLLQIPVALRAAACSYLGNLARLASTKGLDTWGELLSYSVANMLITAACFLAVFALVRWLLVTAVRGMFGVDDRDFAPGALDRAGGLALGLAVEGLKLLILVGLAMPVLSGMGVWGGARDAIASSRIGSFLLEISADMFSLLLGRRT